MLDQQRRERDRHPLLGRQIKAVLDEAGWLRFTARDYFLRERFATDSGPVVAPE